jgi:uncharacterized protein
LATSRKKTVFGTWLHFAASKGRLEIVKQLLAMGCPINGRSGVHDSAPIHLAASGGHYEIVNFLLDSGASLDVSEPERNPLFGAIYGGHTTVAKLLIERGIDTRPSYTGENMTNMDALAFAKEWGRSEIVELLEAQSK